jgi:hypothetical protein
MNFQLNMSIPEAMALGALLGFFVGLLSWSSLIFFAVPVGCAIYLLRDRLFKKKPHFDPYTKSEQ